MSSNPSDFPGEIDIPTQPQSVPTTNVEEDPFANFSSEIEISDDDLPF